jgi:hypothetical protein
MKSRKTHYGQLDLAAEFDYNIWFVLQYFSLISSVITVDQQDNGHPISVSKTDKKLSELGAFFDMTYFKIEVYHFLLLTCLTVSIIYVEKS